MSREVPVLFRNELVRKILADEKTVTRRIGPSWDRVGRGDRLWVRETHAILDACCWPDLPHRSAEVLLDPTDETSPPRRVWSFYRASYDRSNRLRWRPSIHMPRWACRLVLEVESVTAQASWLVEQGHFLGQLLDVDDAEARREGVADRAAFLALWNKLHPGYVGPVWRVQFRRVP